MKMKTKNIRGWGGGNSQENSQTQKKKMCGQSRGLLSAQPNKRQQRGTTKTAQQKTENHTQMASATKPNKICHSLFCTFASTSLSNIVAVTDESNEV